jgi:His-Xaa-Ser system protein HxsD
MPNIEFDNAIYSLSAVTKAAYKFGGFFFVRITESGKTFRVELTPRAQGDSVSEKLGEFQNEVLDQELREQISRETIGVRNLLMAHAFSRTSLINQELDCADYEAGVEQERQPTGSVQKP